MRRFLFNNGAASPSRPCAGKYCKTSKPPRFTNFGQEPGDLARHIYLWSRGEHSTAAAIVYTVGLVLAGMADNVLKPLLLGRGVEAPMPVMLLGAPGGMATAGILGMFVGATLLTLGYQIFMGWVAANPDAGQAQAESNAQAAAHQAHDQVAPVAK